MSGVGGLDFACIKEGLAERETQGGKVVMAMVTWDEMFQARLRAAASWLLNLAEDDSLELRASYGGGACNSALGKALKDSRAWALDQGQEYLVDRERG